MRPNLTSMENMRICLIICQEKRFDPCNYLVFRDSVPSELQLKVAGGEVPIRFHATAGADALAAEIAALAREGRRSFLLTDEMVAAALGDFLARAFGETPVLHVPAGEGSKSLAMLGRVWDFLAAERADRTGVLWMLGGGVVGDLGGFAAATYMRGMDYVQVPTTLLAMVDSAIGGKTGINLPAGKNLAGLVRHPRAVHQCLELLRTLPEREFAAGAAEVVKYGLLGDADLFARLETTPLTPAHAELGAIIRRSCELKAGIVAADEYETAAEGGRALLNLGHTFGHAIEHVAGYGTYLHGEAVAVGLVAAARLSHALGLVDATVAERTARCLAAHGLPAHLRQPLGLAALVEAMTRDKKNRAGRLRLVVLEAVGRAVTRGDVPTALVEQVWRGVGAA
ncbi:MAG: 3-dehydroquinate synthase [Opitutus sp.]|nr:3-dehydroquinate synthase [Opitutus sp.]